MARDVALLDRAAKTGESVFAIYSWARPTLSFGRNQRAVGRYDRSRLGERTIDVVRRPTGGRAILHHREITYSVTAPLREKEPLRAAYERINAVLLDGLARIGVTASIARGGKAVKPGATPCFESPSDGEIVVSGRKLIGSAQWRGKSSFLQHGSILIDDDQTSLASLAADDAEDAALAPPPPATLRGVLGDAPESADVASAMFEAVNKNEMTLGAIIDEDEIRPAALDLLPEFLDEKWTWRR
jgi:lipoyl(octanoyl) transferase